ncbi:MAG: DsrE/DsrF/DrsH-like family protein [Magnetospirillum sp. WYHS-4]
MSDRPEKLSLVVFSGEAEKVHYALVLASGAAAIDIPVTLFFTMEACRRLSRAASWADFDAACRAKGIAAFEELLEACRAMGVGFLVCEMGLKAIGMDRSELRDDLPIEIGGVVTFLNGCPPGGNTLFV